MSKGYFKKMHIDQLYKNFGKNIKNQREVMNLTQEELGKRVELSRASIANIEVGRQKVALHQIYLFAKELNMHPTDLIDKNIDTDITNKEDNQISPWVLEILESAEDVKTK